MKKKSDTLHLALEAKWYAMIASGEKKEEYREIKEHSLPYLGVGNREKYKFVTFHRGYTDMTMTYAILDIDCGKPNPKWCEPEMKDRNVFIIKLGKVVSKKVVMDIDAFCADCKYYDPGNDNSDYDYCCTHPDNMEDGKFGQCTAGGCPLAPFAEERDFLEAGLTKEDVDETSVFVYKGT